MSSRGARRRCCSALAAAATTNGRRRPMRTASSSSTATRCAGRRRAPAAARLSARGPICATWLPAAGSVSRSRVRRESADSIEKKDEVAVRAQERYIERTISAAVGSWADRAGVRVSIDGDEVTVGVYRAPTEGRWRNRVAPCAIRAPKRRRFGSSPSIEGRISTAAGDRSLASRVTRSAV